MKNNSAYEAEFLGKTNEHLVVGRDRPTPVKMIFYFHLLLLALIVVPAAFLEDLALPSPSFTEIVFRAVLLCSVLLSVVGSIQLYFMRASSMYFFASVYALNILELVSIVASEGVRAFRLDGKGFAALYIVCISGGLYFYSRKLIRSQNAAATDVEEISIS